MYEERLGTDWKELSDAEAIDRVFALGVASAFGYENGEEFVRLRDALDSSYDRSIIDLAYEEGKQKARALRGERPNGDETEEDVWDHLVSDTGGATARRSTDGEGPLHPGAERGPAGKLPTTLDRVDLLDGGRDLEALQYPRFLAARPDDDDGDRTT